MFRLAIILSFTLINALTFEIDLNGNNDEGNDVKDEQGSRDSFVFLKPLWVLNLNNDELNVRLRAGTDAEKEDFEYFAEPMINRLKRQPRLVSRKKKDNPENSSDSPTRTSSESQIAKKDENKQVKRDILKLINKFAMSTDKEPDVYLSENEETDGPTLALYFKGQYASLIVQLGRKEWHYFISPPSLLPAWFYEEHVDIIQEGKEKYIEIPETVKDAFFKAFFSMLQIFLSFPV